MYNTLCYTTFFSWNKSTVLFKTFAVSWVIVQVTDATSTVKVTWLMGVAKLALVLVSKSVSILLSANYY